jgi:hypothetical protein
MKKRIMMLLAMVGTLTALAVPALASTTTSSINDVMSTAFTEVAGGIMSTIGTILPIVLGILGTVIAVKFGISFFKRITGASG